MEKNVFDTTTQVKLKLIFEKPVSQFWTMQLGFWLFLCLISLFTLTLWYDQGNWSYIGHVFLQAFVGLLLTLPLYWILVQLWPKSVAIRISSSIVLALIVSFVWTLIRVKTFIIMTKEQNVWADFGGWYFGSIFIFFCWIGLFYLTMYYNLLKFEHSAMLKAQAKTQEEQLKRVKAQSIAKEAQIKMLRYQLNPHFLYNTLNSINSLIESREHQIAQKMTIQLSKFLRFSLENNPDSMINLTEEINILNLFMDIEKVRFGERLTFDFIIEEQAEKAKIPSLLLQPIVENSMKHVIAKNENGGTIKIRAKIVQNRLILELSDTGSGEKINKRVFDNFQCKGVGLRNTNERLGVIYPNNYTFNMQVLPSGALKTTINIPYDHKEMGAIKLQEDKVQELLI